MKKSSYILLFTILSLICTSLCSCSKKNTFSEYIPETVSSHQFYYFTDNGYEKIDKPQNAPSSLPKPWTEATRISCATNSDNTGYALVNRKGILKFSDANIEFIKDLGIFERRTADNLVFYAKTPVFLVYKSSFFNSSIDQKGQNPFLIQFNSEQSLFFPIVNIENLNLNKSSQVVDYLWDGQFWTCCIKDTSQEKIDFSYLTFQPKETLLSITPMTAQKNLFVSETNVNAFRNIKKSQTFDKAPERIKTLLKTVPENLAFTCKLYTNAGHSPRTFIHSKHNAETTDFSVSAILSDSWSCAVFADGTTFFNGALYDRQILNSGKTLAIKLPKLAPGFIYSDFAISGTTMYIAWEESDFYQTKRSGFLSVDLAQALYRNGDVK